MLFLISEVFKKVYLRKQYITGSFPLPKSMPLNSEGFLRMKNSISMHPMSGGKMSSPVVKSIDGLSVLWCPLFSPVLNPVPTGNSTLKTLCKKCFSESLTLESGSPCRFRPNEKAQMTEKKGSEVHYLRRFVQLLSIS